jgi:hypothetical protein
MAIICPATKRISPEVNGRVAPEALRQERPFNQMAFGQGIHPIMIWRVKNQLQLKTLLCFLKGAHRQFSNQIHGIRWQRSDICGFANSPRM